MTAKKINIKNLHLAEVIETPEGTITYSEPEHIPDIMEAGRNPQVASGQLYGDGKVSHSTSKKNAYDVTIDHNKVPSKWRRYMEGTKYTDGVESGTSGDEPNPIAVGWEVEKTGGESEFIWFLYGKATPIQEVVRQSEENINYSTDSLNLKFTEHDSLGRFYTFIDTEDENITTEMAENFFAKVQTTDIITAI